MLMKRKSPSRRSSRQSSKAGGMDLDPMEGRSSSTRPGQARRHGGTRTRPGRSRSRLPLQVPNSGRLDESWDWSRWMIDECICETRDSLRSSVAPISFMVNSS